MMAGLNFGPCCRAVPPPGRRGIGPPVSRGLVAGHPLVRSGQLSAHELSVRYLTVLRALLTLLETRLGLILFCGICIDVDIIFSL